jgi:hypothetical protein
MVEVQITEHTGIIRAGDTEESEEESIEPKISDIPGASV